MKIQAFLAASAIYLTATAAQAGDINLHNEATFKKAKDPSTKSSQAIIKALGKTSDTIGEMDGYDYFAMMDESFKSSNKLRDKDKEN